jgi:hypothetical protein
MKSDIAFISFNSIPKVNLSFKYQKLGELALVNHKNYCQQHGYNYISNTEIDRTIPACWSKIKGIIDAFDSFQWVLWADSDTLIANPELKLENFLDSRKEIISQCPEFYLRNLNLTPEQCLKAMPLNTGVFFIQNTPWSVNLLKKVYEKRPKNYGSEIWDGIGEQEAMIDLLKEMKNGFNHVFYASNIQSHPKFYNSQTMFIHFYGNHACPRISKSVCESIIERWEESVVQQKKLPNDRERFHYACIQNFKNHTQYRRRNPQYFLYEEHEITHNQYFQ